MKIQPGFIPDRILDLLRIDGGWLTTEHIAMRLEAQRKSVERALWRLRAAGLVRSRQLELAYKRRGTFGGPAGAWDVRREWSAADVREEE